MIGRIQRGCAGRIEKKELNFILLAAGDHANPVSLFLS
jgi:hypothetical protein